MIKKIAIGFGVFSVITGAIAIPSAHAYRGDMSVQGPNYSYERHEAMENAFETANADGVRDALQRKYDRKRQKENWFGMSKKDVAWIKARRGS